MFRLSPGVSIYKSEKKKEERGRNHMMPQERYLRTCLFKLLDNPKTLGTLPSFSKKVKLMMFQTWNPWDNSLVRP